jgi:hypothetical protein
MSEGFFKAKPGDRITLSLIKPPGDVFTPDGERMD